MVYHPRCPRCGSDRTYYRRARVTVRRGLGTYGTTEAGWWQCLDCWAKFAGRTDDEHGVLPAGVERAEVSDDNART